MRSSLLFFIFLLLSRALASADLSDVLSYASGESIEAENYRISYENSLLSIRSSELPDSAEYSVSFSAMPLHDEIGGVSVDELSFSAVTPDDDTVITLQVPFSVSYDRSGSLYHPGIGISHTFDFGHDDEAYEELQNAASRLSTERTYRSAIISIKRSVLDLSSSIYSVDLQIEEEERNLSKLRKEKEEDIGLGIIGQDSIEAAEYDIAIKLAKDNIASLVRQRNIYTESFDTLTGLEWEPYDFVPDPVFLPYQHIDGNSETEEAKLLAEAASEAYLVEYSSQHPEKLSFSLAADSTLNQSKALTAEGLDISATARYDSDAWSFYLTGGGAWEGGFQSFSPSLSIGGSWKSKTSERQDELYLEMLANERLLKQNEYVVALSDYREDMISMVSSITAWQAERERQDNEIEYRKALLEQQRIFYGKGLAVQDDVSDAEFELRKAEMELIIMKLEGLSLSLSLEYLLL